MMWWLCCGLALAGAREVKLSVQDPQRQVQGVLQANIHGSEGTQQEVQLKDDGAEPDHTPGDGIFTGNSYFSDGTVHLKLNAGGRTWTADAVLPDPDRDTILRLQLGPEDTAVVLQGARGMLGGPGPTGTPADGLWIWALLLAALGAGAGLGGRWILARPPEAARLSGTERGPDVPPRRFVPDELGRVLDHLSDHQIILVGSPPEGAEVGICLDARVTPEALIRAIEQAAISQARATALVVADPGALELPLHTTAASALTKAVRGRFSLWLLSGPSDWAGLG